MKRWLIRIAILLLTLILLLAALWTWSRLRGPTEEQRQALALMTEYEEPVGRNAFAAIWTLPYDVPEEEQAAVVAEDAAYWRNVSQYEAWSGDVEELDLRFTHAGEKYPDLRFSEADNALLCKGRDEDCLQRVRDDQEAYADLLERNSRLFERVAALSEYDYYRNELPYRIVVPFPAFQYGSALSIRHAAWFVQGEWDAALGGVCSDLSTWRRLGAYSDSLLVRMVGVAFSSYQSAKLLADMLSEVPRDYPLPSSCELLRDPPGIDELSMCEVMRGEFRLAANAFQETGVADWEENWFDKVFSKLFFDAEMTQAELAEKYAPYCEETHRQRIGMDASVRSPVAWAGLWRRECISNRVGCMLTEIASPSFMSYKLRSQDHGARLRLMGALLWLRDRVDDPRPLSELLADLPEAYTSPTRRPELNENGTALRIRQFDTSRGVYWEIPLPPYLWEGAETE